MNRLLLSTVAAAALLASGAAYAQSSGSTADQPAAQGTTSEGAGAASDPAATTPGTAGTTETDPTAADRPEQMQDPATAYGSYRDQSDKFTGEIAGGYAAEDLIDKEVVGPDGDSIGEISDLLIGPGQKIGHAVVDVGGFLGIGAKTIALDIERLQMAQGGDGELVVDMTQEQLEALPAYEKGDEGWMVDKDY